MPSSRLSRSFRNATSNISLNVISDIDVDWRLTGEKSPVEVIIDGMSFLEFSNEDSQEIHTEIRLPNNFISGRPIRFVNGSFFTDEVVGVVRFKVQVAVIRPSDTVQGNYDSVFESVIEIPVNPILRQFTQIDQIELSSLAGVIDGVLLRAKDILKVRLYRDVENESIPCEGLVYLMKELFIVKAV